MSYLKLANLDKDFKELAFTPILANDLRVDSDEDRMAFNNLVHTQYMDENLNLTPSCECGALKAEFLIGETCRQCGTVVQPKYSGSPQSLVWIKAPEQVRCFIKPIVWIMLSAAYRDGGVDVIRWMCDKSYRSSRSKPPPSIIALQEAGFPRGYNNFIDNFRGIIETLSRGKKGKLKVKKETIYEFVCNNYDQLFTQVIPAPSKTTLVLEANKGNRYFDKNLLPAVDGILMATELRNAAHEPVTKVESRVVKIIAALAEFYQNFTKEIMTGKTGAFRKHYFASRLHFSARQVITSLYEPHQADELIIPWRCAIGIFTEHLRSKMLKAPYKMSIYEISNCINSAYSNYDPLIEKLLKEIIVYDTPEKGFPALFGRPPILTRGSVQMFYITGFTTDPDENTIRISPLVLVMPNADFDGDAMHLIPILDGYLGGLYNRLSPKRTMLDINNPHKLSNAIKMPIPIVSSVVNWMHDSDVALEQLLDEGVEETYLTSPKY